jgi:hypothetical protein
MAVGFAFWYPIACWYLSYIINRVIFISKGKEGEE